MIDFYNEDRSRQSLAHLSQMDLARIGKLAPNFNGKAVLDEKVFSLSSSDYTGKHIILLFYPMNFADVCRTELIAFSDHVEQFAKLNTTILACSIESHLTHLKWLSMPYEEGGINGLRIPLIADKTMEITKKFGVLNDEEGTAYRATFIIDDQGILRQISINDRSVGRSVAEVRRTIRAIQNAAKLLECGSTSDLTQMSLSNAPKPRALVCVEKSIERELTE